MALNIRGQGYRLRENRDAGVFTALTDLSEGRSQDANMWLAGSHLRESGVSEWLWIMSDLHQELMLRRVGIPEGLAQGIGTTFWNPRSRSALDADALRILLAAATNGPRRTHGWPLGEGVSAAPSCPDPTVSLHWRAARRCAPRAG